MFQQLKPTLKVVKGNGRPIKLVTKRKFSLRLMLKENAYGDMRRPRSGYLYSLSTLFST